MNGDGHTTSGSGIGVLKLQYESNEKVIHAVSSEVVTAALGKQNQKIALSQFESTSDSIIRALVEYQLLHL